MRPNLNWAAVLRHHAQRTPDHTFSVFQGKTTSYGEMADRSERLAIGLADLGTTGGDVLGILAYNSPGYLEAIFATNHLGAIAMPINWRLAPAEVRYILEHSGAKLLFTDSQLMDVAAESGVGPERPGVLLDDSEAPGWVSLSQLRRSGDAPPLAIQAADDLQRLMYTSGTTARPKGVMITHGNLFWKSVAHTLEFSITSRDIGLVCGPLYHVGALDLTATNAIFAGSSLIIHERFDAKHVVAEIDRSAVTNVWLAPAMVNAILNLDDVDEYDLSSVRFIINGGEKMPEPLFERYGRLFPAAWRADAYGLTESVSGDTFLDLDHVTTKRGSVGLPCMFVDVDIWDDAGESVAAGSQGEIVLRGPKLFKGYWRDEQATDAAFRGGWFHTGDVGYIDDDGYLYIVDRLKDIIISGGENVASSEVERVIHEIDDVIECAVVAEPNETWGEVPVAFVAMRHDSAVTVADLRAACELQLARFKVPRKFVLVDSLPRNPSGKVLKRVLRQELVGLSDVPGP